MKKTFQHVRQSAVIFVAAVLAGVSILPLLSNDIVHAYGLVTSRSIEMSDSNPSDTSVTYLVSFTSATTSDIQGVVVDFCAGTNDPIIGDSCSAPTGFTVGTPTVSSITGLGSNGTWTSGSLNSGRTLTLTNTSANTVSSSTAVSFKITTVTNTSTMGTFYARILDYASTAGATGYTATSPSGGAAIVDAGGIAMSTVQQITITAKVQEQLAFCVYTGGSCGTGTTVTLGNTNGALSTAGPFVDIHTQYSISTNAEHGAVVNMKGTTLTDPFSDTIAAIGSTAASSSAGTSQFGMCTWESTGSTLTFPNATYSGGGNCNTTSQTALTGSTGGAGSATFGFNTTNTTSTYGDEIAAASAGASIGTIAFIGNVSATQVSGIYTTTLTFIATGTY